MRGLGSVADIFVSLPLSVKMKVLSEMKNSFCSQWARSLPFGSPCTVATDDQDMICDVARVLRDVDDEGGLLKL
ncbi:hypothetical protein KCU85_g149, partial [Aureobasidium melanogenum]